VVRHRRLEYITHNSPERYIAINFFLKYFTGWNGQGQVILTAF
jgi:hypothetical protein